MTRFRSTRREKPAKGLLGKFISFLWGVHKKMPSALSTHWGVWLWCLDLCHHLVTRRAAGLKVGKPKDRNNPESFIMLFSHPAIQFLSLHHLGEWWHWREKCGGQRKERIWTGAEFSMDISPGTNMRGHLVILNSRPMVKDACSTSLSTF